MAYNFGSRAARSLDAFGVSGLLGEDAYVFYGSLGDSKHVGRVSDLIAARLQKAGPDELRLRALLLLSFFQAYRTQSSGDSVSIECGIDGEKVAIGVLFNLAPGQDLRLEGLVDRVHSGNPEGRLELMLSQIHAYADRLVLRYEAQRNRLELVSVLATEGMDPQQIASREPPTLVEIREEPGTAPPAEYVELGDLDYGELLGEGPLGMNFQRKDSDETQSRVSAVDTLEEALRKVGSGPEPGEGGVRVSGVTKRIEDEKTVIRGTPSEIDSGIVRVGGGRSGEPGAAAHTDLSPPHEPYAAEAEPESTGAPAGLFKKLMGFFRRSLPKEEESVLAFGEGGSVASSAAISAGAGAARPLDASEESSDQGLGDEDPDGEGEGSSARFTRPELTAKTLVAELTAGALEKTLNRARVEAVEISRRSGNPSTKRWMDGLVGELLTEKSRLQEMAKRLSTSVRHKEIEFRNRERAMMQELKQREDTIRHKNAAISRMKEQVSQMTANIEHLRQGRGGALDDGFKQKYAMAQRMLKAVQDENAVLQKKARDMNAKLTQSASSTRAGVPLNDFRAVQGRADRLARQVEELRTANQLLSEKVAGASSGPSASELDRMRLQNEELQAELRRLRSEISRKNATGSGSQSGGGRSAA